MNCKKSLELHEKKHGKLEIKSKFRLKNKNDLSLAYTPCVAEVCKKIAKDKKLARTYTIKKNTVAVVTDGSAVLGLGNIGPEAAIPVMEGKAILFKKLADIDAFPICLDTQESDEIIKVIKAIAPVFGGVQLEDISAPRCFYIEKKLQNIEIPVVHDDQHSTSIVVAAALINAAKVIGKSIGSMKIVIVGAGAAGTAIAKFITSELKPKELIICDSKGIINKKRKDLPPHKSQLARITNKSDADGTLKDALLEADVFVGVSSGGILRPEMIKTMNSDPIIFAMANPIPEIMPHIAKRTGAAVIGTGRSDFPNQINNVLAYPGLFRGLLNGNLARVSDKMKISAAKVIANYIKNPHPQKILPSALDRNIPKLIAEAVIKNKI